MYKGNGETKAFPLPEGADGRAVYLVAGTRKVRMKEGEGYVERDGSVVFSLAPPVGTEVAFGGEDVGACEIPPASGTVIVLRADGTMEEIAEDPAILLVEARELLREARRAQRSAVAAEESVRIAAAEQKRLAEEALSGRLAKYEGLAEEAVKAAASLARDEVNDHVGKLLLEIRNKHRATVEARDVVVAEMKGARVNLDIAAKEAAERIEERCAPLLESLEEMRSLTAEVRELRDAARNAAAEAGVEVGKLFGARADAVIEEFRSLKAAIDGEVKSVVEGARRVMDAEVEQVRALRSEGVRAAKRCEEIERKAAEMIGR